MNKEIKKLLKEGFEPPAPVNKQDFLRSMDISTAIYLDCLFSQAGYIRKWVWGLSVLIFAISLTGAELLERDMIWCISAFMPLLAMAAITETGRSEAYGMAELEISTRFSLRSVVLARLCILSAADFILICLLIPLAFINDGGTCFQTGVYMVCPYLLTAFFCLWVVRKVRSKETLYLCGGISAGVSAGNILLYTRCPGIFADQYFIWWVAVLAVLGAGTLNQSYQMVKQTEELIWN